MSGNNINVKIADYIDFGVGTNDDGENFFIIAVYTLIGGGKISEFYSLPISELMVSEKLISELVSEAEAHGYVSN